MAVNKFIPVGVGVVTLFLIFGYTMWKSPIKNFSVLRKKYFRIKSKGAYKQEQIVNEVNVASSEEDFFDDVTDTIEDTDDEFHDVQELLCEEMDQKDIFAMVDSLSMKDADCQIEALNILRKYENEFGSSEPELLWRIAQSLQNKSVMENIAQNPKRQNELLLEAKTYAKKALDIDDGNAHAHKWYGLLCGEIGRNLSLREQINGAKVFKDHLHTAYGKIPDDYLINLGLGTFEFEASSRSYIERAACKIVFGKLFDASREAAIKYLTASEQVRPNKRNRFCLARCYLHDNVLPLAHSWLRKAIKLPPVTPDDLLADEEIIEACRGKKFRALENIFLIC